MKIMLVFGTRPEAIKMCPLVAELKKRPSFDVNVCVTGQHREMLSAVLDAFGIVPDEDLAIMRDNQTLFDITSGILSKLRGVFEKYMPDLVLVHGDTTTSFCAGLAAFYMKIPVGHVEAGLRTYDIYAPFPEEFNRRAVGIIAKYNFSPTKKAADNLLREGAVPSSVFITGNTAIDALKTTVKKEYSHPILEAAAGKRLVLVTAHRRESLGDPLREMLRAIRRTLDKHPDVMAVYPVHLNPAVRTIAHEELDDCKGMILTDPLDVLDFHNIMARSYLVLTDSGGIQEEAPALGIPVLVMREVTERPEGVEAGTLRLTGTGEESIYQNFTMLLDNKEEYLKMSKAVNPFGDGTACVQIADIIEKNDLTSAEHK